MRLKITLRNADRATTPEGLHKVFAYGSLKDASRDPVWTRGALYLRDSGQAAVDFGTRDALVKGDIILVDDDGLTDLDRREGAPVVYDRILIKLRNGEVCWAYEWARPFDGFEFVADGVWLFAHLKVYRARYGACNVVAPPRPQADHGRS